MLHNTYVLSGHKIAALDGEIGHIKDFYFDDKTWVIRYLVVDTGSWLSGRLVLLTPHAFGKLDSFERTLHLKLNKKQIENSPSIEAHRPVSRQYEMEYYRYYGWPAYWEGSALWGFGGFPVVLPPTREEMAAQHKHHHRDDKHLQSTNAVNGYHLEARDGVIGTVSGFMVDDKSWAIREMVVEAGPWYTHKEILISPDKIDRLSYEESKVYVRLTRADIASTADHHLVHAAHSGGEIFPTE
jgi:hypothetical protein